MASVYGNKIYNSTTEISWQTRVDYTSTSAHLYVQVNWEGAAGHSGSIWLRLNSSMAGQTFSQVTGTYNTGTSISLGTASISPSSSYGFSATCSGGTWGQDGTSSGTIPKQVTTGHVDVNPEINGTSYPSGQTGFTFNVTGAATASNVTDYNNTSAPPGSYTATPNAKTGYTTTAASGSVTAGGTLTLVPKWTSKSTNITLNSDGATSHGTTSVTGKYDQAMTTITPPSRTGADFLGYYSQTGGVGTKYYNANGSSAHVWDNANSTATLYAHWEFHDFVYVSQNGGSYALGRVYVSQNGGQYTLVDASKVKISQNGGNYTSIV